MVRYKKRYFVVELERSDHVSRGSTKIDIEPLDVNQMDVTNAIRDKVTELHGDHGRASITVGLRVIYVNSATRLLLVQVRHGPHIFVASSLPFITSVGKSRVMSRLLYTGATVRKSYQFMERRQRLALDRAISELKGAANREVLERALLQMKEI